MLLDKRTILENMIYLLDNIGEDAKQLDINNTVKNSVLTKSNKQILTCTRFNHTSKKVQTQTILFKKFPLFQLLFLLVDDQSLYIRILSQYCYQKSYTSPLELQPI